MDVKKLDVQDGRTFTDNDFLSGKRAGIIGPDDFSERRRFPEQLFSHFFRDDSRSFPGKKIIVRKCWAGGQPVEVIGVLKEESGFLSLGLSEMYVPFNMTFSRTAFQPFFSR
jgi:putative ABC transport system permease protein